MERKQRYLQRHPSRPNPDASAYPMNSFRRMVIVGHNDRVIVYNRRPTEQQEMEKPRSHGDMGWYALKRCRAWSNTPPGCRWRLSQSTSTLTEPFRQDGNVFCWCITTDNASSNYSMTCELQSTLEASTIRWPALRNHIPCIANVIQLALGAFMSCLGVKGCTRSWEAHERDQEFGENVSIEIGKSERLRREGNTIINKVSAMNPGLAKIIEKVHISWYFESSEIYLQVAANACSIDFADTWSSKWVHWVSKSQSSHCITTNSGLEDTLELNTGVAQARPPITGIHKRVAPRTNIHWLPVTFHNSRCKDHCEVCHGTIGAISILDPLDVEEAYRHIASSYHSVRWNVPSHGRRDVSFG